MKRIDFISEALEVNMVQAKLISKMIEDIPNDKLPDFFVFRMSYIAPMKSKELITKEALFDFRRMEIEQGLKSGVYNFKSIDEMRNFLMTYYKGKDVANGAASYYDYVVIGLDQEGRFINKYATDDYGRYLILNGEDTAEVLNWLFENQHRIGVVSYVPVPASIEHKPVSVEPKAISHEEPINAEVLDIVKKTYTKI